MTDIDKEKQEAMADTKRICTAEGNLTEAEIEEYINYTFIQGPGSVSDQVRYYFLKVKRDYPARALQMQKEAELLLRDGVHTEQEVHNLSLVLARYIRGFVITAEPTPEMRAEMAQKFPLPLKMLTVRADKPYQVWRGKSEEVVWKAWRQGRPTVLGYGMTEQEAIDDLKYRVQPDHTGELDGEGVPKGPIIGGNMQSREQYVRQNKARFEKK